MGHADRLVNYVSFATLDTNHDDGCHLEMTKTQFFRRCHTHENNFDDDISHLENAVI